MDTRLTAALLAAGCVLVTACGPDQPDAIPVSGEPRRPPPAEDVLGDQIEIVARDLAFDQTSFTVASAGAVDVTFANDDAGIPHNLRVTGPDGSSQATPIETGPVVQRLELDLSVSGSYTFICEVHPTTMTGTIQVG